MRFFVLFWSSFSLEFFGQVWENLSKNLSHPKNLPAPTPMLSKVSFNA